MIELWRDDLIYWVKDVVISEKGVVALSHGAVYYYNHEGELCWEEDIDATSISPHGDGMIAGCEDGEVYCFDNGGKELWRCDVGEKIKKVCSASSITCAATSKGKIIIIKKGKILWEYKAGRKIDDVAIFPELYAAVIAKDLITGRVLLFDVSGRILWNSKINTHIGEASLDISSRLIVVGTLQGVYLFEKNGDRVWRNALSGIRSVAITSDGKYIAAGAVDGKAYLLSYRGKIVWKKVLSSAVRKVLVTDEGNYVCNDGKGLRIFNPQGALIWKFEGDVSAFDITPDLSKIVIGKEDGQLILFGWDGK